MYELRIEGGGNDNWYKNNKPAKRVPVQKQFNMVEALKQMQITPEDRLQSRVSSLVEGELGISSESLHLSRNEKKLISPNSDLGKSIAARIEQRTANTKLPNISFDNSELDNYVPVYEIDKSTPWQEKKLVGYRPKTEQEKSGEISY